MNVIKKGVKVWISATYYKVGNTRVETSVFRLINDAQAKDSLKESLKKYKNIYLEADPKDKKLITPQLMSQLQKMIAGWGIMCNQAYFSRQEYIKWGVVVLMGLVALGGWIWVKPKPQEKKDVVTQNDHIENNSDTVWPLFEYCLDGPVLIERLQLTRNTLDLEGMIASSNLESLPQWISQAESQFRGLRLAYQVKKVNENIIRAHIQGASDRPQDAGKIGQKQTGMIAFEQIPFWINDTALQLKKENNKKIKELKWTNEDKGIKYELVFEKNN